MRQHALGHIASKQPDDDFLHLTQRAVELSWVHFMKAYHRHVKH